MKNYIYLLMLLPIFCMGQSQNQNYSKKIIYRVETDSPITNPNQTQAQVVVVYYDGLGRPIQQNLHKQSANGKDIIRHVAYDKLGRQFREYLPFESNSSDMSFDGNALANTESYYAVPDYQNTLNPYRETFFEASPLNRVIKQDAPGTAWKGNPNGNNDHTLKFEYKLNSPDEVRQYIAITSGADVNGVYVTTLGNASGTVYYGANQLVENRTKDENWVSGEEHTLTEFIDKQGHTVLKRAYVKNQDTGSANFGVVEKADTYYVYDGYGNLSFMIPPKASDSGSITGEAMSELCFQYRYDTRNRLVEKKAAGKAWEFLVYDRYDRMIASGPALSPFSSSSVMGWNIIKYDALGRIAYTGWTASHAAETTTHREAFQVAVATSVQTHEIRQVSTIGNVMLGYSNNSYPSVMEVLSVNYYDDYGYPGAPVVPSQVEGAEVASNVKGYSTGGWTRVLTTATETLHEMTYVFYDKKGRPIRTHQQNHLGGYTKNDIRFDFSGLPQYKDVKHKRTTSGTDQVVSTREDFLYTPEGRLFKHTHAVNGAAPELMAEALYSALGKLESKKTGRTADNPLQTVNYRYNVRGWMTDINNLSDLGGDLFAFRISYEQPANILDGLVRAQYNGNISETFWNTSSDNTIRKYGYAYDALNRLNSSYYQKVSQNGQATYTGSYDEMLTYDKNGNILSLDRNGDLDSSSFAIEIDALRYSYDAGNKLKSVTDESLHPAGFKDGASTSDEMAYDVLGNLIKDTNKGIQQNSISYNHMNLPKEIIFENAEEKKIKYIYSASGAKLQKIVTDGQSTSVTDYLGDFQYVGGVLSFLRTSEGYVKHTAGTGSFDYVYNYVDHLGNIRLSYTENPSGVASPVIMEQNHYYPFGMKHEKYNAQQYTFLPVESQDGVYGTGIMQVSPSQLLPYKYKFNGQEFQDELGLNMTAMDYRQYDSAIGRFSGMDRISELMPSMTPYRFAFNNPNYWSDPTGLFETSAAAMAHISQYGLSGASVSYNSVRGYWEIENAGFSFWMQGSTMIVSYIDQAGGANFVSIGSGGGSSGGGSSGGGSSGGGLSNSGAGASSGLNSGSNSSGGGSLVGGRYNGQNINSVGNHGPTWLDYATMTQTHIYKSHISHKSFVGVKGTVMILKTDEKAIAESLKFSAAMLGMSSTAIAKGTVKFDARTMLGAYLFWHSKQHSENENILNLIEAKYHDIGGNMGVYYIHTMMSQSNPQTGSYSFMNMLDIYDASTNQHLGSLTNYN